MYFQSIFRQQFMTVQFTGADKDINYIDTESRWNPKRRRTFKEIVFGKSIEFVSILIFYSDVR